jgi:hypothetical protein
MIIFLSILSPFLHDDDDDDEIGTDGETRRNLAEEKLSPRSQQ